MRNHQSWAFATIFATTLSQRDNVARPNNFSLVTLSLIVRIMPRLALSLSKKIVAYSALAIMSSYMDIDDYIHQTGRNPYKDTKPHLTGKGLEKLSSKISKLEIEPSSHRTVRKNITM